MTCSGRLPAAIAEQWIRDEAAWFATDGAGLSARGAARIVTVPYSTGALAKRENRKLPRRVLRALAGRSSRPRNAFEVGLALEAAGVEAARPLALIEERRMGIVRRACVVLERIDGVTLREFILERLPALRPGSARDRLKAELWSAIAAQIAGLHAARVRQRDLKAVNVIVTGKRGEDVRVALIDLDGMEILARSPAVRVRVRDLARLAASLRESAVVAAGVDAADWRALVGEYLANAHGRAPSSEELDAFVASTLAWASRKESRNRRRGRVLH
jgi:tRNA A-37 threonylcarbamoyl transferase component Bud32